VTEQGQPTIDLATTTLKTLTVGEIAAYERCHVRTIIDMIEAGVLPAHKVGRHWRVRTADARRVFRIDDQSAAS